MVLALFERLARGRAALRASGDARCLRPHPPSNCLRHPAGAAAAAIIEPARAAAAAGGRTKEKPPCGGFSSPQQAGVPSILERRPQVPELARDRVDRPVEAVQVAGEADRRLFVRQVLHADREAPAAAEQVVWLPAELHVGVQLAVELVGQPGRIRAEVAQVDGPNAKADALLRERAEVAQRQQRREVAELPERIQRRLLLDEAAGRRAELLRPRDRRDRSRRSSSSRTARRSRAGTRPSAGSRNAPSPDSARREVEVDVDARRSRCRRCCAACPRCS